MSNLIKTLLFVGTFLYGLPALSNVPANKLEPIDTNRLLAGFAVDEGKGEFTQKKHFKFLSTPILSHGRFWVKQQSVLWQTDTPVFSQLLVTADSIYRRLSTNESYLALVKSSEISAILATIFRGQIDAEQWQIGLLDDSETEKDSAQSAQSFSCLDMTPVNVQLAQLISRVNLCRNQANQKKVIIWDQQDNQTEILMVQHQLKMDSKELELLKPD